MVNPLISSGHVQLLDWSLVIIRPQPTARRPAAASPRRPAIQSPLAAPELANGSFRLQEIVLAEKVPDRREAADKLLPVEAAVLGASYGYKLIRYARLVQRGV